MGIITVEELSSPISVSTIMSTLASKSSLPSARFFGVEMNIRTLESTSPLPLASEKASGILARDAF